MSHEGDCSGCGTNPIASTLCDACLQRIADGTLPAWADRRCAPDADYRFGVGCIGTQYFFRGERPHIVATRFFRTAGIATKYAATIDKTRRPFIFVVSEVTE